MFKAGVITVSDRCASGKKKDESGQVLQDILVSNGYTIAEYCVIPDEKDLISEKLIQYSDRLKLDLVMTTGGTGFYDRDVTPEATLSILDKQVPGIAEAMRAYSLSITKKAIVSRSVSGIRAHTLIINLPGSPKAVRECLEYIIDVLPHGLKVLKGQVSSCGTS